MRFIKKLVILTGSGAHGTLMVEKNGYGVWCKLNIFDLRRSGDCYFVIISAGDMFVMKLAERRDRTVEFELGEVDFEEIHAAVIAGRSVVMYGSNCALKLSSEDILAMMRRRRHVGEQAQHAFVSFSGREGKIDDYFKRIAPPEYDDYALAEKNYYPAYIKVNEVAASEEVGIRVDGNAADVAPQTRSVAQEKPRIKEESMQKSENKPLPNELERRYLSLMTLAARSAPTSERDEKSEEVDPQVSSDRAVASSAAPKTRRVPRGTGAENPEVIAMARRVTLRDYKVDGVRTAGRKATYFERAGAQIDKLMSSNERFAPAERLIPGSKFVKVNYDGKRYYIVGVIGKDYICYGVPSVYSETPPEPLGGYAKWLPFDESKPFGEGFWMMYQDGVSGETLKS